MLLERAQTAPDHLQAETVMRQVFDDLETDEIVEGVQSLGAAALGELDRGSDKILLVPILQLAQAHADDPAGGLAVKSFHGVVKNGNKTVFMKLDCAPAIVNEPAIERGSKWS